MSAVEVITIVVALWGAGLSTALAIRDYFKDRPRLKVYSFVGELPVPSGKPPRFIILQVTNVGHRPITICDAGLELSNGSYKDYNPITGPYSLPKKLEGGDLLNIPIVYERVKAFHLAIKNEATWFTNVYVMDAERRVYRTSLPHDDDVFSESSNIQA